MKAVIYARVSTDSQDTENQVPVLEGWSQQLRMGFYGETQEPLELVQVYEESESAWKAGHQVELKRLFQDAARGKFKVLIVWALDRLTREGPAEQFRIMSALNRYGVLVWSYQETWTLTPTREENDLLLSIAAYMAQSSSKRNSERTKAGIARVRADGKPWGRPPGSGDKAKRKRRARRE